MAERYSGFGFALLIGENDERLVATDGDDLIWAGGARAIDAGDGDDLVVARTGSLGDIDGGAGDDRLILIHDSELIIDPSSPDQTVLPGVQANFEDIELVIVPADSDQPVLDAVAINLLPELPLNPTLTALATSALTGNVDPGAALFSPFGSGPNALKLAALLDDDGEIGFGTVVGLLEELDVIEPGTIPTDGDGLLTAATNFAAGEGADSLPDLNDIGDGLDQAASLDLADLELQELDDAGAALGDAFDAAASAADDAAGAVAEAVSGVAEDLFGF